MFRNIIFSSWIILVISTSSFAATIHVNPDGSGDYKSIQGGIYFANPYDTILVAPGTYYESTIIFEEPVYLISEAGPESTIISHSGYPGEIDQSVIYINRISEGSVEGFSIRGGQCDLASEGGGIAIILSGILVKNNYIYGNWCASGGGILVGGDTAEGDPESTIINNLIISNGAFTGGGILISECSPLIQNNTIARNTASVSGAAIYVSGLTSHPTIRYNLIYWNTAPSSYCGGIYIPVSLDSVVFECNDSWSNWPAGSDYCGLVSDRIGIDGNISRDPLFCGEYGSDNYYLQVGSPCAESNVPVFCNGVRMGYFPVSCITAVEESSWGKIKSIK